MLNNGVAILLQRLHGALFLSVLRRALTNSQTELLATLNLKKYGFHDDEKDTSLFVFASVVYL